jgi:putative mRNA 3-end processing factor
MVLADEGYQVWLDGMGRSVANIYREHPEYLRDFGEFSHALGQCKFVRNHRGRSYALKEADVIITTGGMLDGGPVLWYLDHLRNDKKSGIALTGYQVEGSNGRRLKQDGKLDFDQNAPGTRIHDVHCEVRHFDFSAHAGHQDLVKFAKASRARDIVLFHGDQREQLLGDLSDFATVHLPMVDQTFVLK